jgi:hypothetical protein
MILTPVAKATGAAVRASLRHPHGPADGVPDHKAAHDSSHEPVSANAQRIRRVRREGDPGGGTA